MQTLKLGSRGADVKILQHALSLAEDGIFGPITEETVKVFQKEHNLSVDGIVGPKTWAIIKPCSRRIDKIIVHCSATPEGKDFTVKDIDRWHRQRGFSGIGYHAVVYRNGSVEWGRPIPQVGAHCTGQNSNSIGVCYIGGVASDGKTPKDTRTPEQKQSLRELIGYLLERFPNATVHGHYEFANKACPSFKICDL